MPELPDIEVYLDCLRPRVVGRELRRIRLVSPFLLRSVEPSPQDVERKRVLELRRIGKRIVFALDDDLFMVLHLMIAGRLHWKDAGLEAAGKGRPGRVRLREWHADSHRGRKQEACVAASGARREGAGDARSRRRRTAHRDARAICQRAAARESHAQAIAHRSAILLRHRQCVLG